MKLYINTCEINFNYNSLDSNKVRNLIENFDFFTQISQEKAFKRCVSKSFRMKI